MIGVLQTRRELVAQLDEQLSVVDLQADGVLPRAGCQRHGTVEHLAGVGDDLVTADLVVPTSVRGRLFGAIGFRDDIGAVQRIVEGAPARVGGVEREARVQNRHHQLRTGRGGDLVVHIGGGDGEIFGLGNQVSDLGQEVLVRGAIEWFDGALPVPAIDLSLQVVPALEQLAVPRSQIGDYFVDSGPESVGIHTGTRKGLVGDEVIQHPRHA
ncbi:Uncharacterised protein [Mycobacteroides abscessus]|nr:Uncharacterised protein [Mycobacteroides abscessus]